MKNNTPKKGNSTKSRVGYWTGRTRDQETKDKIGKAHIGMKYSDESKNKMSLSHMGSKNPRAKEIIMLSLDGLELATFGSISDAARTINVHPGILRYACVKENKIVKEHFWKFKEKEEK